jgi:Protein of unknown function (DUF3024)
MALTIVRVLPESDLAKIHQLCETHVAPDAQDQVRIEIEHDRHAVTIVERRPPWREEAGPEWSCQPIARLRYVASRQEWTIYYHRHTGRWERYPLLGAARRIDPLLRELFEDPICVFWG